MEKIWIRDPGWKKVGSGFGKHPGPATLPLTSSLTPGVSSNLLVGPVCLCHIYDPDHILAVFHLNCTHSEMPVMILSFRAHY
jgi:hypothetical protein